jgi:hypothetical protein
MNPQDYIDHLTESSLSRIWQHNQLHDCGAISAFRKIDVDGTPLSKNDNLKREKLLKAKLINKGYGLTRLVGIYPESGEPKQEYSFFVVDLQDSQSLFKDLTEIGEEFNQDSILFVPKGTIDGKDKAFLYGTNHSEFNWLGYHQKELFNKGKIGTSSPIYTSYINDRPFYFESIDKEIQPPNTGFGWWYIGECCKKQWKDIEL